MEIVIAATAGFCFGVRQAFDKATHASQSEEDYSMLGYLVHNNQVISHLENLGIKFINSAEEAATPGIIIRTHGVSPTKLNEALNHGLKILDATCPRVRKVQNLARDLSNQGYTVIIFGDKAHAEVIGLQGFAGNQSRIIDIGFNENELSVPDPLKVALIAQTTKDEQEFMMVTERLTAKYPELKVFNTICPETRKRQEEALLLSQNSDMILVVGDKLSSNTRVLAQICENTGVPTHLIANADEIDKTWFNGVETIGITAGASTPDWIIKEVYSSMMELEGNGVQDAGLEVENKENEASFADMEAEMAEAFMKTFEKGDMVTGTVVQVTDNEVLLDVGGKSEGTIPLRELSVQDVASARELAKVGDTIEAVVLRWDDDGTILLSKKRVDMKKALDHLEEVYEKGETVTGRIVKAIKGGLMVDVGVIAFLPASHVDEGFVRDLEKYVDQTLDFKIIEFNRNKRRGSQVVLSRKSLVENERKQAKEAFWSSVYEGQIRKGKVKRLTDYGAFIDLGGFEGLLHISEMDYGRVEKPSDVLSEGEEIDVFILAADPEKNRVSLSRKRVLKDPWELAVEKYKEGDVVKGKVVRTAPFGAFVELEPGIDGLVHISQMARHRVEKPEDVVSIGQEVDVKVLSVEPAEKRISLSIKQVETDAENQDVEAYLENQSE
ncbi:MAG: bifunctional 4-hydroxy-3-methylbut-2-enyl diphosphate reductase/30S ribosomal protein S1 [Methylocystaceae bacterium]